MSYRVVIYSPDHHITYDLETLNNIGVGGGITNRVRIAHGLVKNGSEVQLFVNCPEDKISGGVNYTHFSRFSYNQNCDIFIASTSGGNLDLGDLRINEVKARIKILMVHGINPPKNTPLESFDFLYVPSNFIRRWVSDHWPIIKKKIFTCHLGINRGLYQKRNLKRNKYRIMYSGHQMKGLDSAIDVLGILRKIDPRFSLWVFGSPMLWGENELNLDDGEGINYLGTIGQKALARMAQRCRYSLFLQDIPEAFGLSVIESMQAGCIPIASPVGALNETIIHGFNGLIVQGNHLDHKVQQSAAEAILELSANQSFLDYLSNNGKQSVNDWQTIAMTYTSHWSLFLDPANIKSSQISECPECAGRMYQLFDGYHCEDCGNLIRNFEVWKL